MTSDLEERETAAGEPKTIDAECARCGASLGEVALLSREDPAAPSRRFCGRKGCTHPSLRPRDDEESIEGGLLHWLKSTGRAKGPGVQAWTNPVEVTTEPPKRKPKQDQLSEELRAEVRRRIAARQSIGTIARELGLEVGLVWMEQSRSAQERRREQGMKVKANMFSLTQRKDIAARVAAGEKPSDIADDWEGATPQLIGRIAKAELGREGMREAQRLRAELAKSSPPPEPEPEDHHQSCDLDDEDEASEEIEAPAAPERPLTIYGTARKAAERAPEAAPAELEELRRKVAELEGQLEDAQAKGDEGAGAGLSGLRAIGRTVWESLCLSHGADRRALIIVMEACIKGLRETA